MIHVSTLEAALQIMKFPNNILHNKLLESKHYNLFQEDNQIIYPPNAFKESNKMGGEQSNEDIRFADVKIIDFSTKF